MYHLRVYYTRRQVKSCMCSFHNELIVGFCKPFHLYRYYHYFSVFDHHYPLHHEQRTGFEHGGARAPLLACLSHFIGARQ